MEDYDSHILAQLFDDATGLKAETITRLPGAGSNRRYYRIKNGDRSMIGVAGKTVAENEAFIYLSRHFAEKGIPVPAVHAVSPDRMYYIQDDLGDTALFDIIKTGRTTGEWSADEIEALRRTIRFLPMIQWKGAEGLDFTRCYPIPSMDRTSVMWDLNYFKYCFLKSSGIEIDEPALESNFERFATLLLDHDTATFMYRDFQSRNVMFDDAGNPWFIDFQGGRRGPVYYDVASLLWQAKARIPTIIKEELIDSYVEASMPYFQTDGKSFRKNLRLFVLFRTLQVLGAYGFRGYIERKPHFLQSIPDAIDNLRELLTDGLPELPYMSKLLVELVSHEKFSHNSYRPEPGILTVHVNSFGFKKSGIPDDPTGNGGGYVFDCRAIHNPGRYEKYRTLTGRDREVIEFLENDGEITKFLDNAFALVDNSVEHYIKRGFTDLTVSFGCTGGQHRSVYSAEKLAMHLHDNYPCRVCLSHIEQGIKTILNPRRK